MYFIQFLRCQRRYRYATCKYTQNILDFGAHLLVEKCCFFVIFAA